MIISPPMLRDKSATESDSVWVDKMIPVDARRGFPVNAWHTWHGGVHLVHSDSTSRPEKIRAIADGTVHFVRQPKFSQRDRPPYNYNGGTDCGCVVLKHETEIGRGENGKVVFYSLYMHLKTIDEAVSAGKTVYRKAPLGTVGQVDGVNAIHFQVFCDDTNLTKLVGRTTSELDITKDGRSDVIYGDIHFYLPVGTVFYEEVQITQWERIGYISTEPLFVTMSFDNGKCTMTTRRQHRNGHYETMGEAVVSEDDLYKKAVELYPHSPSAGYEMLRFGRIINTEHETLSPADAPHWREVNYPGGTGWVNLAVSEVKKFSDADFPHWMGWQLIDDDSSNNSQCHSSTLLAQLNAETEPCADLSYAICHFPFEWDSATVASRFNWLKSPNDVLDEAMSEADWNKFIAHSKALSIDMAGLPSGRVWHFEPRRFITHFRKCDWTVKNTLTLPDEPLRSMLRQSNQDVMFLTLKEGFEVLQSWGWKETKTAWISATQSDLGQVMVNYGTNGKDVVTTSMVIAKLGDWGIKATVYVNHKGTELIKLTGYPGIRKILNAPVFALKNPKVVDLGIGKYGLSKSIVEGARLTFYVAAAYRTLDFILNDKTSLAEFIGSLATDVVKIGIASAISWGVGAVAVAWIPIVAVPLVVVVGVGILAAWGLNALDDKFGVTDRVVAYLESAQQEMLEKARKIEKGFWDLGAMFADKMLEKGKEAVETKIRSYLRDTLQDIKPRFF
ncbi:M23 family metallopeptidase [Photorhabdus thracensis]|uniref:M23 family metallopeptidase n=1 Tax=Photorhabdus thracensis TaxID=230089 RepID=UPI001E5882AF|nr:M23 family metallopeptidase [Photorhabdus thracensis]